MMHVFVGPTLAWSEPQLTTPGVRVHPPARHGDLFTAAIRDGDTVVLIDGMYHQAPPLRHKELLAAMGRGVRLIGAASIGALRAAELDRFGMLGVGTIYSAYASGAITGDDEVAVGQAPDGDFRALTWPVVSLRHVLQLAQAAGVVDDARAVRLLAALRGIYYPQRTLAAVRIVCDREGDGDFARWLSAQRAEDPHFGDIKRADALQALSVARGHELSAEPRLAPEVWESAYFRRWSNAFARADGLTLSTADRVLYQQVFAPSFSRTWTGYLEYRSRHPADGPGLPLGGRLAEVTDGSLPADRVFHPDVDLCDERTVALLLGDETGKDRRSVARYARALENARRSRPGFTTAAVRDDLTQRLLLRVWQCTADAFDEEASARGLVCGARAVQAAKCLVPGLLGEINETTTTRTEVAL